MLYRGVWPCNGRHTLIFVPKPEPHTFWRSRETRRISQEFTAKLGQGGMTSKAGVLDAHTRSTHPQESDCSEVALWFGGSPVQERSERRHGPIQFAGSSPVRGFQFSTVKKAKAAGPAQSLFHLVPA